MTDTGRDALERVLDDAKQHYPDDSGWWRPGDIPTVRDWVASLVKRAEDAEAQVARLNHCADCCCARAWEALGNPQYDGRTIPEHIATLKSQLARLSRLEAAARELVDGFSLIEGVEIQFAFHKLLHGVKDAFRALDEDVKE